MPRRRIAARRPPASAISKAASAGRLRRWARPAMKATAVPAAILCSASADIPGALAREDYVLPEAHTVAIRIAPQQLGSTNGECTWSWQARKTGGKTESKRLACADKLTIARVPYALDRSQSGVSVTVKLPDGRELAEPEVVVEDLFIVALGDSFASGESNPDRPVQFSAGR